LFLTLNPGKAASCERLLSLAPRQERISKSERRRLKLLTTVFLLIRFNEKLTKIPSEHIEIKLVCGEQLQAGAVIL